MGVGEGIQIEQNGDSKIYLKKSQQMSNMIENLITVRAGGAVHYFRNEPIYVSLKKNAPNMTMIGQSFEKKPVKILSLAKREAHDRSEQSYLLIAN